MFWEGRDYHYAMAVLHVELRETGYEFLNDYVGEILEIKLCSYNVVMSHTNTIL